MADTINKIYGMMASFDDTPTVFAAAEKVRDAGYSKWEVFTPFPVHGMDAAMGLKRSKVPYFTFLGGATGFFAAMLMVWYMNAYDYPLIVGGKPFFSPIFPFPVFYEATILLASFGTFFGMFITNFLPQHYHPTFNHPPFIRASDDTFFILIESRDPKFDLDKTKVLLEKLGGRDIIPVEK